MADPLAEIVNLLRPTASFTKLVQGAGSWRVHRRELGRPFYCAVLEGGCRLAVAGQAPLVLSAGDFVLIPFARNFSTSSLDLEPAAPGETPPPVELRPGVFKLGDGEPNVRQLLGYGRFGSSDVTLLTSLLPPVVHVRGEARLTTLVQLIDGETRADRPARDVVLTHLLEVLMIEALRTTAETSASPGLLRGLADARLSAALRCMHDRPAAAWSVKALAQAAGLSRSAFFERFRRGVGLAPMDYLLGWRMTLARDLLRQKGMRVAEVAQRTGYSSASTFSVAFARYCGVSPSGYAKRQDAEAAA